MKYTNIPESALKIVRQQPNLTEKEREEILLDLDKNYAEKAVRIKRYEKELKSNPLAKKLDEIWKKNGM